MTELNGVPKNFVLKCKKCSRSQLSTGLSSDLKHLKETTTCSNCGGRTFRCPECGGTMKLKRIKYFHDMP